MTNHLLPATCAIPISIIMGVIFGISSPLIPQLMDPSSPVQITKEEATWIASISVLGELVASLIFGYLADVLGRIRMFQFSLFFSMIGFATIAASTNATTIITGRFLTGIGVGAFFPGVIIVSEISPPKYRGIFLSIVPLCTAIGTCVIYVIMGWRSWIVASWIMSLVSLFSLFSTFLYYDSPQSLVQRGKIEEARKSLKRIEVPENVDARLKELEMKVEESRQDGGSLFDKGYRVLLEPAAWKPLLMMITLSFLQSGSGYYIIGVFYIINFLSEFRIPFNPQQILIVLLVLKVLSAVLSSFLLRRCGRKTLGAASGFSSALFLSVIFVFLVLRPEYPTVAEKWTWIPVSCVILFSTFSTGLGIFPLPSLMPNEVFPLKIRGVMTGICFFLMNIFMFIVIKMYNVMMDGLGLQGTILVFIACSLLFGVVSLVFLVETHNKTLDEIEQEFLKADAKHKTLEIN